MALNTPSSEAKKVESAMTNILHNWEVNVKGKIYLVGKVSRLSANHILKSPIKAGSILVFEIVSKE